ncbi:hypothetical protein IQ279_22095 [Streptomyces verrucosisporus]|uniref:hypothetical protein n=1 Tax=Streptomyces verrucosisporus TaxID=1695161 RepID=UPI0019D1505E|nr:hypothetical protein [Streptomyces verrucosisporus]MBN3932283.1 hypothetical protein [Streptomyces verrucosisporus]
MADEKDTDGNTGGDTPSKWTPDDDRVGEIREAERERGEARPFDYPYGERRANVRARRHISREEADADMPPGLSGSYGTTGGGQPAGPAHARPGRSVVGEDPAGVVDRDASAEEESSRKSAGEESREADDEGAGRG